MKTLRDYGAPVRLSGRHDVVSSQTGWAMFDTLNGTPLLDVMSFDGQIVLVDRDNVVRWAFGVRGVDVGSGVRFEYVRRCGLRPKGGLAAGGLQPTEGFYDVICELAASPEAPMTYWVSIGFLDLLTAARADSERVSASARAEAPAAGAVVFRAWTPGVAASEVPADGFAPRADSGPAPTATPVAEPDTHDFY